MIAYLAATALLSPGDVITWQAMAGRYGSDGLHVTTAVAYSAVRSPLYVRPVYGCGWNPTIPPGVERVLLVRSNDTWQRIVGIQLKDGRVLVAGAFVTPDGVNVR